MCSHTASGLGECLSCVTVCSVSVKPSRSQTNLLYSFVCFQGNGSNREGANQRAEFTATIEAAKSKIHQVGCVRSENLGLFLDVVVSFMFVFQYKVRAYIQMKSSKACKREIKSVMNTAGNVSNCWNHPGLQILVL